MIGPAEASAFAECVARGGVAVFPADTVYGLACAADDEEAARRLYELKGRPADKPAAVMFFTADAAFAALPEMGGRTREVMDLLLPGPVTLLLENPHRRFAPACGPDPTTLGLRVPDFTGSLAALASVDVAVLQSSANVAGGPDARRLEEVPEPIRAGADLVLDGGPRPGVPSTVVDLRGYERHGRWEVVRHGAIPADALARAIR